MAVPSPAAQFDAAIISVVGLTQKEFVATAKREHGAIMRTRPIPISFKRYVDGKEGVEDAVKPGGVIVYDYNRIDTVAYRAWDILREFSPVDSGLYRDSHKFIVNGQFATNFKGLQQGQPIIITNSVEYARIVELVQRGGAKLRIDKGGHVYERTARRLRSDPEVANAARVEFTYRDFGGGRASRRPCLIISE
jgi:hypothetical protein